MNNEERKYLLNKCIEQYTIAKKIYLTDPAQFLIQFGKAVMLKEIIEKYIDCQPKKYYEKYIKIVKLHADLT